MSDIPIIDLDELEGKALAATAGPWTWSVEDYSMADLIGDNPMNPVLAVSPCRSCMETAAKEAQWKWGRCLTPSKADAEFIAAANPFVVLKLVRMLRNALEKP